VSFRIFLVEDNPGDVLLIREALRRAELPYSLDHHDTVASATAGLQDAGRAGGPVPDLILLDYNLPGGDGSDVLAAAAENPSLATVPRAVITSFLSPHEREQARRLGATCFMTKPASLNGFLEEVGCSISRLLVVPGNAA